MKHSNPFDHFRNYETLQQMAKRVTKKYGLSDYRDIMLDERRKGKRPSNAVADARGEFIYEAYKTGRYSLKHIGKFLRMCYGKSKDDYRQGDLKYVETHVNRMLTRWCKRYNVERPRWGVYSKPYWRAFNADNERNSEDGG